MQISIGKKTDKGCVRDNNEDSFYVEGSSESIIFAMADGMGGQIGGEVASGAAVEKIMLEDGLGIVQHDRQGVNLGFQEILEEMGSQGRLGGRTDARARQLDQGQGVVNITVIDRHAQVRV